ncbi:UNVERIFIED_CONTAM: hypothetical protein FKN15_020996 [Acipenser sinensis]
MDGEAAPVFPLDLRTTRKAGTARESITTTDKTSIKRASRLETSANTSQLERTGRMGCKDEAAGQRQDWGTESSVQGPCTVPPRCLFAQGSPGYQALVPSYSAQTYPYPVPYDVDSVWRPPLVHISNGSGLNGVYLSVNQQREHGQWGNDPWRGQTAAVSPLTTKTTNATSRTVDSLERPQSAASSSPVCKMEPPANSHEGAKAPDKPALSLPLRKRPYPAVDTEESLPVPYPQAGYPYCPVPAPQLYLGGVITMPAPPFPVIYPMEEKLASDIAMATRQDEDGDTHQSKFPIASRLPQKNPRNQREDTPLHLAVITHQPQLVGHLVGQGASAMLLDRNGQTAIHLACEHSQQDCLQEILGQSQDKLDLEARNYQVENNSLEMVNFLIEVIDALRGKGSRVAANPKIPEITAELLASPHGSRSSSSSPTHTHNGNSIPSPGPAPRLSPLAAPPAQHQHHLLAMPPSSSPLLAPPQRPPASQSSEGQRLSPGRDESHVQCRSYQPGGALSPAALPNFHSFSNGPPFSPGVLYAKQGDYRNLPQGYYLERPCIPHPTAFLQPYLLPSPARSSNHPLAGISLDQSQPSFDSQSPAPLKARPSSRSSDQSDLSTMSVSSGGKGES